MSKKKRYCCICGKKLLEGEWGNNPEPVKPFTEGTCCNDCNRDKVLPLRSSKGEVMIKQSEVRDEQSI